MALPTITFNSSTGSDTQASGAGPATALFGTGAATNSNTSIDLSADAPNLSGVSTTGSDVLWVDTASGRQFFKITAVDNVTKIVTVANAAGVTASGLTWGLGGKRATFGDTDSRKLFSADILPGWTVITETDQSISALISCSVAGNNSNTGGPIVIKGSVTTKASRKRIIASHNGRAFELNSNYWRFENLLFSCTNGTKTGHRCFFNNNDIAPFYAINCGSDTTDPIGAFYEDGTLGASTINLFDCDIINTVTTAIQRFTTGGGFTNITNCTFKGCNTGAGTFAISMNSAGTIIFANNFVVKNVSSGIEISTSFGWPVTPKVFINNNISYNTGTGIQVDPSSTNFMVSLVWVNNIVASNIAGGATTSYGFSGCNAVPDIANRLSIFDYNTYFANKTAAILNINQGAHDITTENPTFTDPTNLDFGIGNTNLEGVAFPGAGLDFPGTITSNFNYPGPSQPQGGGSSASESFSASFG